MRAMMAVALLVVFNVLPAATVEQAIHERYEFMSVSDLDGAALYDSDAHMARVKHSKQVAEQLELMRRASEKATSDAKKVASGEGLTREGGVNYHNGRRETYYSSAVLYHYRTPEWVVDDEGFYRDGSGRYIVAASDLSQGSVFQGSKGECIVLDCGCAPGTTDYYVNW